ncbi:MAG: hypothetical protein K5986_05550 [Clostridium sp.]|uniref:hypothetical protein n=1 Tax=Clostridium sp. DSM 8431 TaxID=1761781 RepID=UPI0008EB2D97|nr:hypothetical protein [Clostridium sp. DSM 8431]MCR4943909.1 hypothetical protein [Clostridium sp.]SFU40622.1 hypothetical protein SAMN04487886_102019 [Clostridium sp. DSM 8431]
MELYINNSFLEINELSLEEINAGTFWGAVGGVAATVGGVALLGTPESTGLTKVAGYSAVSAGITTTIGGIATIANNI